MMITDNHKIYYEIMLQNYCEIIVKLLQKHYKVDSIIRKFINIAKLFRNY